MDQEVKYVVERAQQIALSILNENQDLLEETVQTLLQQEILEGVELHEQLNRVQSPPELNEWLRTGKLPQDQPQHKPKPSSVLAKNQCLSGASAEVCSA
ncbi:MAG: hypothetical protein JOZ78_01935 [Chroococcidiopsidaceae cyanobacterium CP_BM_ER_R8_30]|nr:hypothetical protein [Chroococcidiopsidaceae cyanobacterium CP_BM_ER_R8_30]